MIFDRNEVLRDLRQFVAEVTFTKVNGQQRVMRCTLRPDLLPEKYVTEEAAEREFHETNQETIRAWDLQANGWRSFRMDSVSYFQVIDAY